MCAHMVSVNTGLARDEVWAGNLRRTAIDKRPVPGRVTVGPLGLAGDEVADTKHHGGIQQAVYAFAQEDLDVWTERLGDRVPPGTFGENITTEGIDGNEALIGERWRVGTALLEITCPRIPCVVFKNFLGLHGFDDRAWVRRFTEEGRPGPYLKVLEEGTVAAGDQITVQHRPAHGITLALMFRALTTERDLLPRLADAAPLAPHVQAVVDRHAASV